MDDFFLKYVKPKHPNAKPSVIRTKINNERKAWDNQKNERLKEIGLLES